ncbi:hypothetical protein [Streptomyces sp. NPDC015130]|uniref:hypothetical protein n=1 Tax=Streptomyces sp. NPDC015130 TaxID=3364940 RepID=UPI0037006AC5
MTRGRGRPAQITPEVWQQFLDEVAAGSTIKDASALVGFHYNVPPRRAQTDKAFAAALRKAKSRGQQVRDAQREELPHGESRYNHLGCRCGDCLAAATAARSARRATTARRDTHDGQVLDLDTGRESPTSFLLPRPSSPAGRAAA